MGCSFTGTVVYIEANASGYAVDADCMFVGIAVDADLMDGDWRRCEAGEQIVMHCRRPANGQLVREDDRYSNLFITR